MKISFTNPDRTRALVTKGLLRSRQAEVEKRSDAWWYFVVTGKRVPGPIDTRLDNAKADAERVDPWVPVGDGAIDRVIAWLTFPVSQRQMLPEARVRR